MNAIRYPNPRASANLFRALRWMYRVEARKIMNKYGIGSKRHRARFDKAVNTAKRYHRDMMEARRQMREAAANVLPAEVLTVDDEAIRVKFLGKNWGGTPIDMAASSDYLDARNMRQLTADSRSTARIIREEEIASWEF